MLTADRPARKPRPPAPPTPRPVPTVWRCWYCGRIIGEVAPDSCVRIFHTCNQWNTWPPAEHK